jgi:hypothetical protein
MSQGYYVLLGLLWLALVTVVLYLCWDEYVQDNDYSHVPLKYRARWFWLTWIWNGSGYECALLEELVYKVRDAYARAYCKVFNHKIRSCGYGGPDSGNDDHECVRCGEYWHVPMY